MKKLLTAITVLAAATGCVGNDTPIDLGGASALDLACEAQDIQLLRGSLNVAGSNVYIARFSVTSTLMPTTVTTAEGDTVEDTTTNEAVVKELRFSYQSNPAISLPSVTQRIHSIVPPNSSGDSFIQMNLFPGEAGLALVDNVVPGDRIEVIVGVQAAGNLRSGAAFTTNTVYYPVDVSNTGCEAGFVPAVGIGPCGNTGQDGAFACCPQDNPACIGGGE